MINLNEKKQFFLSNNSYSLISLMIPVGVIVFLLAVGFSYLLKKNVNKPQELLAVSGAEKVKAQQRESKPSPSYLDEEKGEQDKKEYPKLKEGITIKKDWKAESVLVKDHKTGKILLSKNIHKQHPLASITKLMSALVLLNSIDDWNKRITIAANDMPDSLVDSGEIYSASQLWSASLVGSSNKSIFSLVDSLNWPKQAFLQRMNKKAQDLQMKDTYFTGVTGLNKESVSTAEDISFLLNEVMKHKKIQQPLTTEEIKLKPLNQQETNHVWNTDWLLLGWIPNKLGRIYGGKTGHIEAAGYNFTVQVSDKQGHVLDIVVLGAKNHEARFKVAKEAARWVFDNYKWQN